MNIDKPFTINSAAPVCWRLTLWATLYLAAAFAPSTTNAQETALFERGDAVVTGFSGTKQLDPSPTGDPIDETFIDLDGASAQILRLEPGAPPSGQLFSTPPVLQIRARDVGQVFAVGLDEVVTLNPTRDPPNIYLGATSAFGLQIVLPDSNRDGRPERAKTGHPNAEWMAGQFGLEKGGGPGSVWRVDGNTGAVSLFAMLPGNSGPGLGDIVFDPATRQLFVSDLDTGLIHRLDSSGALRDTFDHGQAGRSAAGLAAAADDGTKADIKNPIFDSQNPATWGFTQPERRVWGLGLRAGRLYYAVAEGPAIWSVSINLDGTFGADPRREIEVSGTPNNNPISDIAFDSADYMYVAQRGGIKGSYDYSVFADAKQSVVFRFKREIPDDPATPGIWVPIPDEYAVGFPPDYRNTSGGLALGYGYDQTGAIRSGACDATIWSTGDALRDSAEYAAQLAAGGPAIVNGLQGTDRSLIRPDNEPPFKAYFVDYDGKSDDLENRGHVGDVEIWQACDHAAGFGGYAPWWSYPSMPEADAAGDAPAGAPSDTPAGPPSDTPAGPPLDGPWPPVPPPAPDSFNLRVDKEAAPGECAAGGIGWICNFTVRVTNTGPELYFGDLTVTDRLPAAPAGAVMTFSPPWACVMIAPTEHQCTHPLVALLPGEGVDLFIQVELPADYAECFLDNVVRIDWPAGFGDADRGDDADFASASIPSEHCVRPPEGPPEPTNLRIQKSAVLTTCRPGLMGGFDCGYVIQITNTGPGVYSGSIEIDDQLSAIPAAWVHSPDWDCTAVAGDFRHCTHPPVVLRPGESVSLEMWANVPDDFRECELHNQVRITNAPGGSEQNTDPGDDVASASATIPSPHCIGERTNLRIQKRAMHWCRHTPPDAGIDAWECIYRVRVTNMGPGVYSGPLEIEDQLAETLPAGSVLSLWEPGGGCSALGDSPQTCSLPPVTLAPGAWVQIHVHVLVLASYDGCELTNTARIAVPAGGSAQNTDATDDESSATSLIDSPRCRAQFANLRIRKMTLDPECLNIHPADVGPAWQCRYAIQVRNTGPGVYSGPIEIEDVLPALPAGSRVMLRTIPAGGCGYVGAPLPSPTCTLPDTTLGPGGWTAVFVDVIVPQSYDGCDLTNTVKITMPSGRTAQNTDRFDDESTAVAAIPSPRCRGSRSEPIVSDPEPPVCPQGWSKTPVPGKCCPPRTSWDGKRCKRGVEPPKQECPKGFVGTPPNCKPVTARPKECPKGTTGKYPDCKPIVPECKKDEKRVNGKCERAPGSVVCDPDSVLNRRTGQCEPLAPPSPAKCPKGFVGTPPNCKQVVVPPKECPKGTTGKYPDCKPIVPECKKDEKRVNGKCVRPTGRVLCGPDSVLNRQTGQCEPLAPPAPRVCPKGFTGTPPNCKPVVVPPKTCPKGFVGTPPNCKLVIVPPKKCPKGFVGTPPNCKKAPPKECPKGFVGTPPNCKLAFVPPKTCPKGTTGVYPNCKPVHSLDMKKL